MKDHARWEGNEGSSSCQEPPLEGGLARQDAVAGPASGSSSSGEEKRLMAARLQKAANSANCNTDVLAYLEQGADPSAADIDGRTALHYAAMNGHTFAVVCLCAYGSDLKARTNNGRTALHGACWNGHTQTVLQLIELGADVNAVSFDNSTPLIDASRNSHAECVSALINVAGADVHAREAGGRTALHFAALNGHTETVVTLIGLGASADAADGDGSRPVHFASWNGHTGAVRALLMHGASVSPRDAFLSTPLHDAALGGRTETAGLLLDYRADVDAKNYRGITPLHSSSSSGHAETTALLLESGAAVDAQNDDGRTALHFATWNCQAVVAFELLSRGADMFLCSDDGLMAADILCNPDFEWPEDLLRPLHRLRLPCSPMHDAAEKGDRRRIEYLASCGVDVNSPNSLGDTPLHWAIRGQHVTASARLLGLGANIVYHNNKGVSCSDDVASFLNAKQQQRLQRKAAAYLLALGVPVAADGTLLGLSATAPTSEDELSQSGSPPLGSCVISSSDMLALQARAVGRERVANKKRRSEQPPSPPAPPADVPEANPDSPSDCNPDDEHNLVESCGRGRPLKGEWTEHPVRKACMQIEAWVLHLPGMRTWLWTKRETFGLCAGLEKAGDAALLAFTRPASSVPASWASWISQLRTSLEQVAEAAYSRDAKGLRFALSALHPSLGSLVPGQHAKGGVGAWLDASNGSFRGTGGR